MWVVTAFLNKNNYRENNDEENKILLRSHDAALSLPAH